MGKRFAGKVAWITGATSGIGRACALQLAAEGARVAVSGRREERLRELVDDIEALGGSALAVPCDVCVEEQQRQAVERILEHWGQLDIALANAGFSVAGRVEDLSSDDWHRQLNTNVVGAAMTARYAIPALKKTRGRLALTGSVAAFMAADRYGAYHVSKHAIRALGLTLSIELASAGVSCTTLHPGFVASEINQVDNDGHFDASRPDKRPAALMWSAKKAAQVMLDAIYKRKRDYVFTGHGKVAAWLGMHFPGLVHRLMTSNAMKRQSKAIQIDEEA